MKGYLTVGEAADRCGVQCWRLRRLFERGLLDEPERVGHARLIPEGDMPRVRAALEAAGYLKGAAPAATPERAPA